MRSRWFVALTLTGVLLLIAACASDVATGPGSETAGASQPSLSAVTTIYPVTYFTQRVGGERVQVKALVSPGVDAHDFEPKPSDVQALASADLIVYNHPAFEPWFADAVAASGSGATVIQAADLPEDEDGGHGEGEGEHEHEGGTDPHVWLNPLEAVEQVRRIQVGLASADPDGQAVYVANAEKLMSELLALDDRIASSLQGCEHGEIVVSHLAYGHLAERYGIHQLGLSGLSGEFESGPQQVAQIVEEMRSLGLKHVLQEPVSGSRLAETVAAEAGAEVLPLHPLETLTPAEVDAGENYFSVMEKNVESLKTALACGA